MIIDIFLRPISLSLGFLFNRSTNSFSVLVMRSLGYPYFYVIIFKTWFGFSHKPFDPSIMLFISYFLREKMEGVAISSCWSLLRD